MSVKVAHWKDADAAIATVDQVLQKLGIGHHFGVSLLGINGCYVAEQEGDEVSERLEYQGKCYLPSFSAKPPPSSLGQ
ncbi:hypothetical protein [Archangium sp. Cb G35]|uniref:hypothetical protein n=1 Tax=Archangium sp. Cb G35 TaxID=1920190 RepID=UPI00116134EC|nr:hypothetical protein [Archangium sp. Cb G35]